MLKQNPVPKIPKPSNSNSNSPILHGKLAQMAKK